MSAGLNARSGMSKHHGRICRRAFMLREMLAVVVTLALLAATVLPALFRSSERVLRARCVSNLRQVGVASQTYANEANDFMPICKFGHANPTQYTYEAARAQGAAGQITQGYMNLGLLVRNRHISDPQLLYCPAQRGSAWTYQSYISTTNGWFPEPESRLLRVGYNYFPQLQLTQRFTPNLFLPRVTLTTVPLEFGSTGFSGVQPMRFHELNLNKSIVTDLVHSTNNLAHRELGVAAGVNALFPDGRVTFQSARANPNNFSPVLWGDISTDGLAFRQVMNGWKP